MHLYGSKTGNVFRKGSTFSARSIIFQLDVHNRFTLVNCFELFEFKRRDVSGLD